MKKSRMIGVLSVMSVSLCAFALGMGVNGGAKAYAENEAEATKDFYMENGASVRIDENAGVRFSAHISESRYNAAKETAGEKEVKLVTIVNRADLGATHGAANALEFEYNLADASAKDGEYTVVSRVTYSKLEESMLLNAASVELEAKCYLVIGNDWATAEAAESNDNVRSMRSVAYAALSAGTVEQSDVEKYLGTVNEETEAFALLNTVATKIDVSELSEKYSGYTAAYLGAKKIGDVKNGKIALTEAYTGTAETITLMDSANNVVTAPLKYAGDLSAEVKSHKYGSLAAMQNGTEITLEKDGKQTKATVEGGKITAANLPAGTYSVKSNNYLNGELKITAGEKNENALTLEYDAFAPTAGMTYWGSVRDFSAQNDGKITLNNDIQFIYSKDTFKNVAFTLTLQKDWNSANKSGRQGISFRFKNENGYQGIAAVQTEGERILQFDGQGGYATWWKMPSEEFALAEGSGWDSLFLFENRTALKEKLNNGTLEITVVREGATFYVFADGEYVGGKTFADKYADMECELGFYYLDFAGNKERTWNFEIDANISSWLNKIETNGISAEIYQRKANEKKHFTDGTKVTFVQGNLRKTLSVENGKVSGELVPGTYSVYTEDSYAATLTIDNNAEYTDEITLEYKVFDLFNGWDEAQHDFSHVNDENPTIGMAGKTLNVISRDSYNDVAASLWIKKGNSTHVQDAQGVVIKFSNGSYMFTKCEKLSDGTYKLHWMAEIWGMSIAKAQWLDYQQPMTDAQNTAFESEDGLQLTVVRSGNVLTVYVNGEKISGGTVILDEAYASMTAQVGFFDYDSKENATWKYKIESDISAYDTTTAEISETKLAEVKTSEYYVGAIEEGNATALVQRLRRY